MKEPYLLIDPSGDLSWVEIDRVPYTWCDGEGIDLKQVYSHISCSCVEQVRTVMPGIALLVDDIGRIKHPLRRHNEVASRLYAGWLLGRDNIVGPALVVALRPTGPYHELDAFPLNAAELNKLSLYLGVEIPEHN